MVTKKIKAISEENEAERFGLLMIYSMKPIEREYGNDYADAVLRRHIKRGPYANEPEILGVLQDSNESLYESEHVDRCNGDIQNVFEGYAAQLLAMYEVKEQAERILMLAIASFLSEKYHVKEPRMLGWA